jgi:hypothetical protein
MKYQRRRYRRKKINEGNEECTGVSMAMVMAISAANNNNISQRQIIRRNNVESGVEKRIIVNSNNNDEVMASMAALNGGRHIGNQWRRKAGGNVMAKYGEKHK